MCYRLPEKFLFNNNKSIKVYLYTGLQSVTIEQCVNTT